MLRKQENQAVIMSTPTKLHSGPIQLWSRGLWSNNLKLNNNAQLNTPLNSQVSMTQGVTVPIDFTQLIPVNFCGATGNLLSDAGSQSYVYLVNYQGRTCVFKKYILDFESSPYSDNSIYYSMIDSAFNRELNVTMNIRSPYILKSLAYCIRPAGLVLEYMPKGSLQKYLEELDKSNYADPLTSRIMHCLIDDIANGLCLLHSKNIIHHDIKSGNILLDKVGPGIYRAKLCDFAYTTNVNDEISRSIIGSPYSAAPEVFDGKEFVSQESDVYSFGIVCLELMTTQQGRNIIHGCHYRSCYGIMDAHKSSQRSKEIDAILTAIELSREHPPALLKLIEQCINPEQDLRPSMKYVVNQLNLIKANEISREKQEDAKYMAMRPKSAPELPVKQPSHETKSHPKNTLDPKAVANLSKLPSAQLWSRSSRASNLKQENHLDTPLNSVRYR